MLDVASKKEVTSGPSVEGAAKRTAAVRQNMVLMSFGEQQYAIPLAAIQEILPLPSLCRPPRMPAILDGFMNLGGNAVAVVNLARLFDLPESALALYTPLLLLRAEPPSIALKAEKVLGLASVAESDKVRWNDRDTCNECAQGVAIIDDRAVILLSPERLLLKQERDRLADLRAAEQMRLDALPEGAS